MRARLARLGSWRRPRPVVVVGLVFAGLVLMTSMPVSALLTQHHQLAATSAALAQAQDADRSLAAEAKALADGSTVGRLARTDYGLVPSGQKAYVILPPAGSSSAEVAGSGHVPLEGPPVEPGSSQSQQLLGLGGSASPAPASRPTSSSSHGAAGGFWSRVARTLEFWR
jgi:cell division protein FtsB